jgi:predicted transcriptional regulator
MKKTHERQLRVAEPVQVYLEPPDQRRLERLADQLRTTKSAVLRRGLEALERQVTGVNGHPALRVIGIADQEAGAAVSYDVAREHDRYLAALAAPETGPAKAKSRRTKSRGT